jgi:hypothetical protein
MRQKIDPRVKAERSYENKIAIIQNALNVIRNIPLNKVLHITRLMGVYGTLQQEIVSG